MKDNKRPCVYCAGRYLYSCIPESDRCKYAHANRKTCQDPINQQRLKDKYPGFSDGSVWGWNKNNDISSEAIKEKLEKAREAK